MTRAPKKTTSAINIAVIGYDPLRLVGLCAVLEAEGEFAVHNVDPESLGQPLPGTIVLMGSHGVNSVFDTVAAIRAVRPHARIILSSASMSDEAMLRAISMGAKGCIDEAAAAEEYKQALREVYQGSIWAPRRVLAKFVERATTRPKKSADPGRLSERELQVLELLVAGRTNREIGFELGIEERTVKCHVSNLMQKAGVNNRIALSVYAVNHELFTRSY